jgi:hypothetical protein
MRQWGPIIAALVVAGCSDPAPTGAIQGSPSLLADVQFLLRPVTFSTQLRSQFEVPPCASQSKGRAQVTILVDGSIEAVTDINNRGAESVLFGHIHHVTPGAETGPIIWWLTTPVATALNLTGDRLEVRQAAWFAENPHFPNHLEAMVQLLAFPDKFYVNFHSVACPGGFVRGFLH